MLKALTELHQGKPADLDGDGRNEATLVKTSDGGVKFESDWNGDNTPDFVSIGVPRKSRSMLVDNNLDGRVDWKSSAVAGPPATRTIEEDQDFDGTMDLRIEKTFDFSRRTIRVLIYTDPDGDGTFSQVSDHTLPLGMNQPGACDGQAGLPANTGAPRITIGDPILGGPIHIPYGGGGGRCNQAQARRLGDAIGCALGDALVCLMRRNREMGDKIVGQLLHGELIIGCGNTCGGVYANTEHFSSFAEMFFTPHMNTNPAEWSALSNAELCSVMLHELLHWAGEGFNANHAQGTDRVYACGRYCGGCTSVGPAGNQGSDVDCAKCAKTLQEKAECGTQEQLVQINCSYALCHKMFSHVPCASCMGWQEQACDGTPLQSNKPSFACCAACPPGYTKNDIPCGGANTKPGTCASRRPPECP